jgi:DNA-binding transcriptional LysR family regulator
MNVTQLKTFVTVVEQGSFSDAARALGISQPAVTMQIKALEADAGATLLDRRYRRVELTEAGRALLPHANRILSELSEAREAITSLSGMLTGRLAISASTTPGAYVIPPILGAFVKANPQVQLELTIHDSSEAVAAVEAGLADLGVVGACEPDARVNFEELGCDEICLICHPDNPLAGAKSVAVKDLAEEDWVTREPGSGTGQVAARALAARGLDAAELRVLVELGSGEAVVSAVEGGLGIALVSKMAAAKALTLGTVARVDLASPPIERPFFVVLSKGTPTHAAVAFLDHMRASMLCEPVSAKATS